MYLSYALQCRLQNYSDGIAKVQKQLQNYSDFSQKSIVKTVNKRFFNNMLYYYFSLEVVLQGVAKNNPTGK